MECTAPILLLSACVHPPETNVDPATDARIAAPSTDDLGTVAFRHSGWASWRSRVRAAMLATAQVASRVTAFDECGSHAWLISKKANTSAFRIACDHCHDRFCLPCANERSSHAARTIAAYIKTKRLRFITLTLRTETEPLVDSLNRLLKSFRKLRCRAFWRTHSKGGASFVEVKWNEEKQRWHPHLHILQEGRFMEKQALAVEWYHCTGDSYVVDIKGVKDPVRAAEYVAKYATKGYSASIFRDKARLEEAMLALAGRRLMMCFGSWRGFSLTDDEAPEEWDQIASLANIRSLAQTGSRWAAALIRHLLDPLRYETPGPMPVGECLQLGLTPKPDPDVRREFRYDDREIAIVPHAAASVFAQKPRKPNGFTPAYKGPGAVLGTCERATSATCNQRENYQLSTATQPRTPLMPPPPLELLPSMCTTARDELAINRQ